MNRWEHKIETCRLEVLIANLNAWGEEGWEPWSRETDYKTGEITVFLKRAS